MANCELLIARATMIFIIRRCGGMYQALRIPSPPEVSTFIPHFILARTFGRHGSFVWPWAKYRHDPRRAAFQFADAGRERQSWRACSQQSKRDVQSSEVLCSSSPSSPQSLHGPSGHPWRARLRCVCLRQRRRRSKPSISGSSPSRSFTPRR